MQFGDTALTRAARYGHRDVVELLLGHGARTEHQNQVIRGDGWEGAGARSFCVVHCVCGAWAWGFALGYNVLFFDDLIFLVIRCF